MFADEVSSLKGSVNIAQGNALGLSCVEIVALKARFDLSY